MYLCLGFHKEKFQRFAVINMAVAGDNARESHYTILLQEIEYLVSWTNYFFTNGAHLKGYHIID